MLPGAFRNLVLVPALIAAPALWAAPKVTVNHDDQFDFSALKSYAWRTHPVMEKNPELANRAIAGDIVMSMGNEILMGRGFVPVDAEPDFYATFFVKGTAEEEATMLTTGWYYGPTPYWSGTTQTTYRKFLSGTLVLDIVDAKANRLVWRAFCHDDIKDMKERHKSIAKAVEKALKSFPPKKSK